VLLPVKTVGVMGDGRTYDNVCALRAVTAFTSMSLSAWMADVLGSYFSGQNHTVVDRLLLLLEQILEDELAPGAAACVHQRATLVELSQLDGCEPELFGQGRHGSGRVLVVAR